MLRIRGLICMAMLAAAIAPAARAASYVQYVVQFAGVETFMAYTAGSLYPTTYLVPIGRQFTISPASPIASLSQSFTVVDKAGVTSAVVGLQASGLSLFIEGRNDGLNYSLAVQPVGAGGAAGDYETAGITSSFGSIRPEAAYHAGGGATALTLNAIYVSTRFSDTPFAGDAIVETAGPLVPEPATWAMMVAGFGLVGAALRRRADDPARA